MFVNFNILNQLGSPAINSNTFANRPAAGQTGRLFVSTDTYEIYRDNGTTWDLIGGPGSSTITGSGTATQVAYFTSSQAIGSSANLFWDNTQGFLGVATATPSARIEAVKTDGVGIYANYTTNAGSGSSATAIWAKNITNGSGFAAVIEETTPNTTAGQYPLLIKHSLSSGTAGVGMGTGLHFQLPDDAGTFKTTQLTIETINAAAATYATRYRFNVQSNGSSTPVAYINATGLGLFTATPGAALDIHSTGTIAQLNSTGTTNNGYLAFQRTGATTFSIGDTYNGGSNYFRIFGSALSADIVRIFAATGESFFTSTETYSSGNSIGVSVQNNLTIPNGVNVGLAALGGVNSNLNLSLGGSTTIANTGRQGLEGSTTIGFTGAGTLTMTQGSTVRAFSALSSVYAFNGSAVGTITHLAGLRICFPDNVGSAVNITNNYALLINNQTTGTGTVSYTNRWGIYQEGSSDLNYFAANTLIGTTVNNGNKLQVSGTGSFGYVTNNTNAIVLLDGNLQQSHLGSAFGATFIQNNNYYNGSTYVFDDNTQPSSNITLSNGTVNFQTGIANVAPNTKMTLSLAGNLGIGVTPAAWENSTAFQVDNQYAFTKYGITRNAVYNAGYKYIANGFANSYEMNGGAYQWFTAVSGTAGNAITFTQPMTLTAGGNLLIGTTTDAGQKLQVNGNGYFSANTASVQSVEITNASASGFSVLTLSNTGASGRSYDIGVGGNTSGQNNNFYIFDNNASSTRLTITPAGNTAIFGAISTGAPTGGTAASWKLGSRVAATVVLSTTEYIELDVNGTLYKLAIVT